jgi:VanZ family protein
LKFESSENKRRGRLIAYAPLILWTALILVLGSSTGSMAQTSRIIKPLIEFFLPTAAPETVLIIHAAIRKTAHFVEYAVLAMLAARAYGGAGSNQGRGKWAIWTLITVVAVAAADEFVQSFNVTRTGSPLDVLLDLAGGIAGLLFFVAFGRLKSRRETAR